MSEFERWLDTAIHATITEVLREQEPTLDEVLRRDPRDIQEEDYIALMRHMRSERAARVTKGEKE